MAGSLRRMRPDLQTRKPGRTTRRGHTLTPHPGLWTLRYSLRLGCLDYLREFGGSQCAPLVAIMAAALGDHANAQGKLDASYTISFARIRVGDITANVA